MNQRSAHSNAAMHSEAQLAGWRMRSMPSRSTRKVRQPSVPQAKSLGGFSLGGLLKGDKSKTADKGKPEDKAQAPTEAAEPSRFAPKSPPSSAITIEEISVAREKWIQAAKTRDIDAMVTLYDPEVGCLLGTIDTKIIEKRVSPDDIQDYFTAFLGANEAVEPRFPPEVEPRDVIQLGDGYASYSGYYDFALTKDGKTNIAHAKFSYIYKRTPFGLKIVTHNSGLTPKGIASEEGPITAEEVMEARSQWVAAISALDVKAVVALYHPDEGRLLGTIDTDDSQDRTSQVAITEYFNRFLGSNSSVQPCFPPQVKEEDLLTFSEDCVAYSGYYTFNITSKAGVAQEAKAKFTFIYKRTPAGLKILTHNSGLTPEGVTILDPQEADVSVGEILLARQRWMQAVSSRDPGAVMKLYDSKDPRLVGTIDARDAGEYVGTRQVRNYFRSFLKGHDRVVPNFDCVVREEDVTQLGDGQAVHSSCMDLTVDISHFQRATKTRVVHTRSSIVYQREEDGELKIKVHNSSLAPRGIEELDAGATFTDKSGLMDENARPITLKEVQEAITKWSGAVSQRNVDATVACYDPETARLLGTIDDDSTEMRDNITSIRSYFKTFLGTNDAVVPRFPKIEETDVVQLGNGFAVYSGYYEFVLQKQNVQRIAFAKFSYVFKRGPGGLLIVTHNSGLTPKGIEVMDEAAQMSKDFKGAIESR